MFSSGIPVAKKLLGNGLPILGQILAAKANSNV
jgi:hypothetical protein